VLHKVLPGEEVEGTELASGGKLKYKFNSIVPSRMSMIWH